jgi:hypothetical protein
MDSSFHQEMLKQAVAAAREGDYEASRDLVGQVLAEDEENIRAWLLLARLSDNINEKRMALTTVLNLEPDNTKAQELLDRLDAKLDKPEEDEFIPGISRRNLRLVIFSLIGVVVLLLGLLLFISNQRSAEEESEQRALSQQQSTAVALAATQTSYVTQTRAVVVATTEAWLTEITATHTLTPTPTITNTPTATSTRATALPPPDVAAGGTIYGWGREGLTVRENLPIVAVEVGSEINDPIFIGDGLEYEGIQVSVSASGNQLLYISVDGSSRQIRMISPEGERISPRLVEAVNNSGLALSDPWMPIFHPTDDSQYAVVGEDPRNGTLEVYLITAPAGDPIPAGGAEATPDPSAPSAQARRLTRDENADYTFPAFSPDGSQIVAVREDTSEDNPGFDLVVIDVETGTLAPLTTDRDALIETQPRWSPNGQVIAFAALTEGEPETQHDIYVLSADGSGNPIRVISDPADDIYPVYSPDGQSIAFASDRGIDYNIFIYNTGTQQVSAQVTDRDNEIYPGDWIP